LSCYDKELIGDAYSGKFGVGGGAEIPDLAGVGVADQFLVVTRQMTVPEPAAERSIVEVPRFPLMPELGRKIEYPRLVCGRERHDDELMPGPRIGEAERIRNRT